jgi:Uma2 family endonuclease
MDVEPFLAWPGDGVNHRHQLIDGEPVAMDSASWMHGAIVPELAARLRNHLVAQNSRCRVIVEPGVQPRVGASLNVRIPDLAISCRPIAGHLMQEPVLIAEILSPTNARETREAVRAYLSIPSVREIVVISSGEVRCELIRRDAQGAWPPEPGVLGEADTMRLDSFDFACRLADLYPP